MDYCKYHPLAPATYRCPECQSARCDPCVDEGAQGEMARCFLCGAEVESLGAANAVEPFWRRLPQSFQYPMNRSTLLLIIGVSVISTLLASIPSLITFLLWVCVTGVMVKYSFLCLQHSASGMMAAPGTGDAFQGGVSLIINIIGMMIVLSGAVYLSGLYLGAGVAGALALLFTLGLPAVIINYAVTESFGDAVNPLKMLSLIGTIGLPYGLLLAFLMILSASVGIISGVISDDLSILSAALQSVVSYYYLVVTFHILGYIIFQNQAGLGFTARGDYGEERALRSDRERQLAKLSILVKEGRYEDVLDGFKTAVNRYPDDRELQRRCFDFLYASGNSGELAQFANRFFRFLQRSGRQDLVYGYYLKLLRQDADYMPASAELRDWLARACQQAGNPRLAVKLLAGLHRDYPDYPELSAAYLLLADCLDELPEMGRKAEQFRQLARRLKPRPSSDEAPVSAEAT